MMFLFILLSTFFGNSLGYDLVREYAGETFFDRWNYYGLYDNLTLGDVNWVDRNTAFTDGLTYVSNRNTAVIRVDNYTVVPYNQKRNSVRITSSDYYELGSLWVFDAVHLPYGCSVWPAWWTKGINWPEDGEIDIIENINLAQRNQMALHTTPGCFAAATPDQSGHVGPNIDCSPGSGCVIPDLDPRSWGEAYANVGGGVWAAQFDVAGIFIWFWSRADVPSSLNPSAPATPLDISKWGLPIASYPSTTCNISQFFTPQQLILDITLCGDWAGVPSIYQSTCSSQPPNDPMNPVSSQKPHTPSCYADNVVGSGSRYDTAYFEINHIRAYTTSAAAPSSTPSSVTFSPPSSSPQSSNSQSSNSQPGDSNAPASPPQTAAAVVIRPVVMWTTCSVLLGAGLFLF